MDWDGRIGRTRFPAGRPVRARRLRHGGGLVTTLFPPWPVGKLQVPVWPKSVATSTFTSPSRTEVSATR